jgi:hypothetical protein
VSLPELDVMGQPSDVLSEAFGLIRGDRLKFYGPPTENFERIAKMWTGYLGVTERVAALKAALDDHAREIDGKVGLPSPTLSRINELVDTLPAEVSANDVCSLMILLKVARIRSGGSYHRDSAVDAAGYAALLEVLNEAEVSL